MNAEDNGELPEGWALATLCEITRNFDGQRIPVKADDRKSRQGKYPYYGASGVIDSIDDYLFDGEYLLVAEDGANLLSRSTPIAFQAHGRFWVNNHAHILQTVASIPLIFVEGFLNHLDLQEYVTGSAQPKLTQAALNRIPIVVPPLAEQRRIVAAVEAVLAKVNAARERLNRVPAILKRFRQAVLSAACSGRLTADWREKNSGTDSAGAALTRLNLTTLTTDALPDESEAIPDTWRWVRFGDLVNELRNGLSPRPSQAPPGLPILRINAVRPCEVLFTDLRYMPDSDEQAATYALRDGDLLFTRYNGSLELLGVCGMVRGLNSRIVLYPDKLMRIRFAHAEVLPEYCELFFSDPAARDRMIEKAKSSAGQNGISGADVKGQPFALPPLPEQQEIVRRVAELFALADVIETRLTDARRMADQLTQAVLAKAFRGELVPTEAELARRENRTYEPAAELLARVRAEREQPAPKPARKRKPKTDPA